MTDGVRTNRSASRGARILLAALPIALSAAGCSGEPILITTKCHDDPECPTGQLCQEGTCVDSSIFQCTERSGGGLLQPSPVQVQFENLENTEAIRTLTLRNIGDCVLTVFDARLDDDTGLFSCPSCGDDFPVDIFPFRETTLDLSFRPEAFGTHRATLALASDDGELSSGATAAERELIVPLHATFFGAPELVSAPETLDFGYTAVGEEMTRTLRISNHGTGTATLDITDIRIDHPGGEFAILQAPETPIALAPLAEDPKAYAELLVRFQPRARQTYAASLGIVTPRGTHAVPVRGTAEAPPSVRVSPEVVQFGEVFLGEPATENLVIQNTGGAPLEVLIDWAAGTGSDFWATPDVIEPIPPGGFAEIAVQALASAAGTREAQIMLMTNDPSRSQLSVPVVASATERIGRDVLKVEMTYANDSFSVLDEDIRNVDIVLENPRHQICSKANPSPQDWAEFGRPTWVGLGPREEPEWVALPDATEDGPFRVLLQYQEDCASLPTQLVADLLGIGVDVLIRYLSEGLLDIDGQDLAAVIAEFCVNHEPSTVNVAVWVNGRLEHEARATLGRKGDTRSVVTILRNNGRYEVQ